MTAPKEREEIQRYTPDEGYGGPYLFSSDDGDAVLYSDHLRHLKLAQIEALEDLHQTIVTDEDGHDPDIAFEIEERIAALREELGGE